MKLLTVFALIAVLCAAAMADPRLWGPHGVALSYGGRVEWPRAVAHNGDDYSLAVWSDIHAGNRDVYAQLIGAAGEPLWGNGIPLTTDPREQSCPTVAASEDGWIVAWIDYRNVPRGGQYDPPGGEIYIQKLDNDGLPQWTEGGVRVDSTRDAARGTLQLLSDREGGAMLVWGGANNFSPTYFVQRITDTGTRAWPRVNVNPGPEIETAYSAATDGSGGVIIAWKEQTAIKAARISVDGSRPWGIVTIAASPSNHWTPVIASDGNGGCYVAWPKPAANNSTDIWAQYLDSNGGRLWAQDGVAVCTAPYTQDCLSIAPSMYLGVSDGCLISWRDPGHNSGAAVYYVQKVDTADGTLRWGENGLAISDTLEYGQTLSIVTDGEGGLVTAWASQWNTDLELDIHAMRINSSGLPVWPQDMVTVCAAPGYQHNPLVTAMNDGVLITYENGPSTDELEGLSYQKLSQATGARLLADEGAMLVSWPFSGVGWGFPVPMSGGRTALISCDEQRTLFRILNSNGQPVAIPDSVGIYPDTAATPYQLYPGYFYTGEACPDGNGGFFFLQNWGGDESGYEAFLGHVGADGQSLGQNGLAGWVWEGADAGDPDDYSRLVSPDSTGGCYVAFQLWYPASGLYLMRMTSACEREWSQPVQLDTVVWYETNETKVATSADGSCIVAWLSYTGYRLAKVNSSGTIVWRVAVSDTTEGDLTHPKLVTDGQDGAYCTWLASASAPSYHVVRAQHVEADGRETWPHGGIRVSTTETWQAQSRPVVDNAGFLLVAWLDEGTGSDGEGNIYAQKISPAGALMWGDSGRAVCTTTGVQLNPAVVPDGANGLFVAWEDDGNGSGRSHISATHLDGNGISGPDPYWVRNAGGLISDTAATANVAPRMISCDAGTAVLLWSQDLDQSGVPGQYDFFAQRIAPTDVLAAKTSRGVVSKYALHQNYPNPFNPTTQIQFDLPQAGMTKLMVYDLLGREVATLVDRQLNAGEHRVEFDASNLSSGVYFYRLQSGNFVSTRKMIVLK